MENGDLYVEIELSNMGMTPMMLYQHAVFIHNDTGFSIGFLWWHITVREA